MLRSEVWVRGLYHVLCNYVPLEGNIGPHPVAIQTLLSIRGRDLLARGRQGLKALGGAFSWNISGPHQSTEKLALRRVRESPSFCSVPATLSGCQLSPDPGHTRRGLILVFPICQFGFPCLDKSCVPVGLGYSFRLFWSITPFDQVSLRDTILLRDSSWFVILTVLWHCCPFEGGKLGSVFQFSN